MTRVPAHRPPTTTRSASAIASQLTRALARNVKGISASLCVAFSGGLLWGRVIVGASWGHAVSPGVDALLVTALAPLVVAIDRLGYDYLLERSQRIPPR